MISLLPTLLGLLAVAAAGIAVLEVAIRRTVVGFALVVLTVVLDTALSGITIRGQVGPFAVYPNDVVFGLLGAAAAARLLRARRIHPLQVLVLIFLAISLWSAVRGVPLFGAGTAINEARKNLLYCFAVLYFSTEATEDRPDAFVGWWTGLAAYLLAVAAVRWALFFGGLTSLLPQGDSLRVLDSFDTVILLTGFLLAAGPLVRPSPRGPLGGSGRLPLRHELFLVGSFLAIVLLQHRTLWIALVLGLALLTARNPRMTGRLLVATAVGAATVSVLAIALFGQGVERVVTDELSSSATNVDTFDWRLAGWASLLERSAPDHPVDVVFGHPFGAGFDRYVGGQRITVSPHNYFLESYLRTGVAGLAAFVALHVALVVRLYRSRSGQGRLREDALGVAVVVLLLYYLTSHPNPEHGVLTGLALAVAMRPRRRVPTVTAERLRPAAPTPAVR